MRCLLSFTVPGKPISQGSLSHNRAGILYQKPEVVQWREKIMQIALIAARQQGLELPLDQPVHVHATFYLKRPKQPRFDVPATALDLDKLQRAVGDALSPKHGTKLLANDNRIVHWTATKHYADPGDEHAEIEIWGTPRKETPIKWLGSR